MNGWQEWYKTDIELPPWENEFPEAGEVFKACEEYALWSSNEEKLTIRSQKIPRYLVKVGELMVTYYGINGHVGVAINLGKSISKNRTLLWGLVYCSFRGGYYWKAVLSPKDGAVIVPKLLVITK